MNWGGLEDARILQRLFRCASALINVRKCGEGVLRVILCADASVGGGVFPGMRAASSRGVVLEACLPQMRQAGVLRFRCVALQVCCVFAAGGVFLCVGKWFLRVS